MLMIETCVVTPFQQNCRLVVDSETSDSILIDPGGEASRLHAAVAASGSRLSAIVLTHSHIDHCAGVAAVQRLVPAPVPLYGHEIEAPMRATISEQALMFGLDPGEYENCPEPTSYLDDGDSLQIGPHVATALFTPGHAPGHLAFFLPDVRCSIDGREWSGPLVFAGDALFAGSIGRTDLPGGNHRQLLESIRRKLLTLPDETVVLCGHGPATTIGGERETNPFLS